MAYALTFNGSNLSVATNGTKALACRVAGEQADFEAGEQSRLRRAGMAIPSGVLPRTASKRISIEGEWAADSLADFLDLKDDLEATYSGVTGNLYAGRDDRFYRNAVAQSCSFSYQEGKTFGVWGVISIDFLLTDPEALATSSTTPTLANTGGTVAYSAGTAWANPTWTIVVDAGGGAGDALTLSNTTTGEIAIIRKPDGTAFADDDVIVLSSDTCAATLEGVATVGLFDRRLPRLKPGNNTITLSASGTLTVASLACSYVARFA